MTHPYVQPLLNDVDVSRLQSHLEWFAHVRRDSGGPGEDRTAAYIADTLRKAGVPVTVHEYDAYLSYPLDANLRVEAPESFEAPALTHSFGPSVPEGITGELMWITDGNLRAAAGKVALVDGLATPVTILQASQAGCVAVIFANQDWMIHNMIGTTIWGTPGIDQLGRLPRLPVVSVNKESGERLKRLRDKGRVSVRVATEVRTGWFRAKLPEVRIEGTEEPDLFCLAGGHSCSWHEGMTDNSTGCACLLEMARILWAHRATLRRSVRLCFWPGHSHGRYSGSAHYADTFFTDLAEGCLAYHNIDSPGVRGATWYIARHTTSEVEQFCQTMIEAVTGQANAPVHRPARAADQSFLANGVPSFSTYPFLPEDHPDRRPWTGGSANGWWWHTDHDTLDKADAAILAKDVALSLTAVAALVNAQVLPLDYARTAREIEAFVGNLQTQVGEHFDFGPILADAARLTAAVIEFEAVREQKKSDPSATRALNRHVIRLGRILNPVIYSQVGRFAHDPAEWSPMMRATKHYTLAALAKSIGLVQLADTPDYGFLRAQIVREANRVRTALREAAALIAEAAETGVVR